jgi:hypothetical protein
MFPIRDCLWENVVSIAIVSLDGSILGTTNNPGFDAA